MFMSSDRPEELPKSPATSARFMYPFVCLYSNSMTFIAFCFCTCLLCLLLCSLLIKNLHNPFQIPLLRSSSIQTIFISGYAGETECGNRPAASFENGCTKHRSEPPNSKTPAYTRQKCISCTWILMNLFKVLYPYTFSSF